MAADIVLYALTSRAELDPMRSLQVGEVPDDPRPSTPWLAKPDVRLRVELPIRRG